jgi:hypothetical protein
MIDNLPRLRSSCGALDPSEGLIFPVSSLAPRNPTPIWMDACMVFISRIWAHKSKLGTTVHIPSHFYYEMYAFRTPWLNKWHCEVKYSLIFFYHCHMQIKLSSQRRRSTDLGALAHQPRHLVSYRFD